MREWLVIVVFFLVGCKKEVALEMRGEWSLDRMESVEDYWLPGLQFTLDTVFDDVAVVYDTLYMYTAVDGTLTPVNIVGHIWERDWVLNWTLDTALWIGGEPWSFIVRSHDEIVIENVTRYGIVGEQVRTLYMKKK